MKCASCNNEADYVIDGESLCSKCKGSNGGDKPEVKGKSAGEVLSGM